MLVFALQSLITVRILKMFHFSRPAIVRVGVFMGFVGTFFLAFASNSPILLIGKLRIKERGSTFFDSNLGYQLLFS